jgi:hypothetical protein
MKRVGIAAIAFGVSLLLAAGLGSASEGPFSDLAGSWSGAGTLTKKSSGNERLRCQTRYDVGNSGEKVDFRITCASDSFKFDLSGYIVNNDGAISGQWSEPNYNSSGSLDGRVNSGKISARAVGNTFSALLVVATHGSRQTVTIEPQETDVTRLSLTFQRR